MRYGLIDSVVSGDVILIPAEANTHWVIYQCYFCSAGLQTIALQSGVAAISGPLKMGTGSSSMFVLPFSEIGWWRSTTPGVPCILTKSGPDRLVGNFVYRTFPESAND